MRKGVLFVNLGSPQSPSPVDVKKYLHEFLLDKRVIDLPFFKRHLLVRGIIVPRRYKESAKSYQCIWQEGSPLLMYSFALERHLKAMLPNMVIQMAMRYQVPSIAKALSSLKKSQVSDLLLFPLFPQYAEATTGSVIHKVFSELKKQKYTPRIKIVSPFATESFFVDSLVERAKRYEVASYDHILFSFHGLPVRQLKKNSPGYCQGKGSICCQTWRKENQHCYAAQCYASAAAVAQKLGLANDSYTVTFQSRLGKDPWIEPFTNDTLIQLAKENKRRVLIFSPSFVADCLETIYEIGIECKHLFLNAGGEVLDYTSFMDRWNQEKN